jgi:hypothetical protein
VKVGRNELCPCGSGAKVKRCCGVEGARRSREALDDLFALAFHFPRQRPASATFKAWAKQAPDQLTRELVEEGLAHVGTSEEERITTAFAAAYPPVWESILDEACERDDAQLVLLVGAVVAGLEEQRRPLDAQALKLLELDEDARDDPVETLALMLTAGDLWNVLEAAEAAEALDHGGSIEVVAKRLWSEWHEERLAELVQRLQERLPATGFETASSAIEHARRVFERDGRVRMRLRSELLLDALPTLFDGLRLAA